MKSKRELIKGKSKNTKTSLQASTNSNTYVKSFPSQSNETYIEDEQITIPTPYPQQRYMLIEDENLINSKYTKILNEKYPPRKYVKHNLTSWRKLSKDKTKEIKFQFTNPKLKFEDYNLKKITYNNEEIGEVNSIRSIQDAMNLIDKLKSKLIEYELTNNENIETAQMFIKSLGDENDYYKTIIMQQEDKINLLCDKFDLDKESLYDENQSDEILVQGFRNRWLKRIFFYSLAMRIFYLRRLKFNFHNLKHKVENVLKLKAFLSLERNYMQGSFSKQIKRRLDHQNIQNLFGFLRKNWYLAKVLTKFNNLQRIINLMVYLKELRLNSAKGRYYQDLNKKSLFKYYLTMTGKVMKAFKTSLIQSESYKDTVKFHNFFNKIQKKFKNGIIPFSIREQRVKGLISLRKLFDKILLKDKMKIINCAKDKRVILQFYFKTWRNKCKKEDLVLNYKEKLLTSSFSNLIKKTKRAAFLKNKPKYLDKKFTISRFINTVRSKVKMKDKIFHLQIKNRKKTLRNVFFKKLLVSMDNFDPLIKINRVLRKMKYLTFFETIKGVINQKKKSISLTQVSKQYRTNKINEVKSFNPVEFIIKMKILIKAKKRLRYLLDKFKLEHLRNKNFHKLRLISLMTNFNKKKSHYESIINNIKTILEEKSEMITKLELDSSELILHCETLSSKYKETSSENEMFRRKIHQLESKLQEDKAKFNELWNRNVEDIKNLRNTLNNNEMLLAEAIKREEKLQHKYCVDIQNAIKLNKHLNTIIAKKNQILLELKLRQDKVDQENRSEQMKLYKENANLFNEYAQIIELKELEKKHREDKEEEKRKFYTEEEISKLKEDKRKAEYKSELLEQENKIAFESMLNNKRK